MFSATWPLAVHQLAQEFMDPNPVKVCIISLLFLFDWLEKAHSYFCYHLSYQAVCFLSPFPILILHDLLVWFFASAIAYLLYKRKSAFGI